VEQNKIETFSASKSTGPLGLFMHVFICTLSAETCICLGL